MECEHLNWSVTPSGRYRVCTDCERDLGAVGDEYPSLHSAGGVSPTAPDERERLADELEAIARSLNGPIGEDVNETLYAAGTALRRSREATTEPRVVTDKAIEAAAKILWIADQEDQEWAARVVEDVFSPADDWPDEAIRFGNVARAALNAAFNVTPK